MLLERSCMSLKVLEGPSRFLMDDDDGDYDYDDDDDRIDN